MGIYERPRIKGPSTFQVKIRRGNLPPINKSFSSYAEAEKWEKDIKQTLELCAKTDLILPRLKQLAEETGKAPEIIIVEALKVYAEQVQARASAGETPAPVPAPSFDRPAEPAVELVESELTKPLSELLSADQLQRRVAELDAFVKTITPKLAYQEPKGDEYPVMMDTIKRYEQLLHGTWLSLGIDQLYTGKIDDLDEYEFVVSRPGFAHVLQISEEELSRRIASQQIPLPGAYSLELATSAKQARRLQEVPTPDCWTLMQAAAVLAGHGAVLAKRDVSPNWYRFVIAESEMAILMAGA